MLPLIDITSTVYLATFFPPNRNGPSNALYVVHATKKGATNLPATAMRDANISGPQLRDAHRLAGRYLATEYLTGSSGELLSQHDIPHVQGQSTKGYSVPHEEKTTGRSTHARR